MRNNLSTRFFKDKQGNIVLFQPPNAPILTWFICTMVAKLVADDSTAHSVLNAVAFGALFTWAWLELFTGVNYFRKLLGLTILVLAITLHVS